MPPGFGEPSELSGEGRGSRSRAFWQARLRRCLTCLGITFTPDQLDGFDVAFVKLVRAGGWVAGRCTGRSAAPLGGTRAPPGCSRALLATGDRAVSRLGGHVCAISRHVRAFGCSRLSVPPGSRSHARSPRTAARTSFYVGLRNGNCDFATSGVELDPQRAACPASCTDPSQSLIPVLPEDDYITNPVPYQLRLSNDICCLEYSTSHYMSGFALMSRMHRSRLSVLDAIFSMEILNVAMPVLCGLISYGTLMWLLERGRNPAFKNQTAGVYYAFVSTSPRCI